MTGLMRAASGVLALVVLLHQLVKVVDGDCMYRPDAGDVIVCRSCSMGNRVSAHCTRDADTQCTPCEPGTYADTCNDNFECKPCDTECRGEGWMVSVPCTTTANLRCKCGPGYQYRWRNGIIYCQKSPPTTAPPVTSTPPTTRRGAPTRQFTPSTKTTTTTTSKPVASSSTTVKASVAPPRALQNTGAEFQPKYGVLFYVFHGVEIGLCIIILLFLCGVLTKCRPVKKSSFFKPGVLTYPGSRLDDIDGKVDYLAQELGYYRHEHAPSTLDRILQALELRRGIQVIDSGSHYRLPPPHHYSKA
ncbi:tumor necrosis factor receptor superfamily member 4 [Lingula anatina]|uniref:Tumor necrosis factor receptor superfamily member 4 n=1 Tax=Lingula anatina TaxID=7574 RepID=A0A1S3ITW6_LINAN|nr:tumor necrosis factor receptor superfamily member 4 [Lingula anatina]|eukprot:XP_013401642.1 tumor necrosis factor receptor superfamily member 4 [Lingula anatina]